MRVMYSLEARHAPVERRSTDARTYVESALRLLFNAVVSIMWVLLLIERYYLSESDYNYYKSEF